MSNEIETIKGNIITDVLRLHDLGAINSDVALDIIKNVLRIKPKSNSMPQRQLRPLSKSEELTDEQPFEEEFDNFNLKGGNK